MRIRTLAAGLAGLALFAAAAAAQPAALPGTPGARGLHGSTLSTSRIPDGSIEGPGGMGLFGALLFRDPRFQNALLACDDAAALARIQGAFAEKEARFWGSGLAIAAFDRIRLVATNPWGQNNIPRRYCSGRVHLNDGRVRTVSYAIMEDQGLAGYSWGVEWCVHGLDRGRSFDPACRMARP